MRLRHTGPYGRFSGTTWRGAQKDRAAWPSSPCPCDAAPQPGTGTGDYTQTINYTITVVPR
jgi:hypothetical protein